MIIHVSDHIVLKEIELSDSIDVFNTIDTQRKYLGQWLPFVEYTQAVDDSRDFIQSVLDTLIETRDLTFIVQYDGSFAGLIGFKGTDKANKKSEIGYWLSDGYQKNGIMTDSVKALMEYAFSKMNMNRIQIRCGVGNQPSRNIPRRLGFHFEGIERAGELFPDGRFIDLEVYSKLKDEVEK